MNAHRRRVLVLGLGNTMLSDDGVGVHAARLAAKTAPRELDVREAEIGGLGLLEIVEGYDRLVVIDASTAHTAESIGSVGCFGLESWPAGHHLVMSHGVDLPTALRMGAALGMRMPEEVYLVLVAAQDVWTCSDSCTAEVAESIPRTAELAVRIALQPHAV